KKYFCEGFISKLKTERFRAAIPGGTHRQETVDPERRNLPSQAADHGASPIRLSRGNGARCAPWHCRKCRPWTSTCASTGIESRPACHSPKIADLSGAGPIIIITSTGSRTSRNAEIHAPAARTNFTILSRISIHLIVSDLVVTLAGDHDRAWIFQITQ